MIDILRAKNVFNDFINNYENKEHINFKLKVIHTYHVAENAKIIAQKLNLKQEDIELAELIGILHDIGRFEELKLTGEYNSLKFDHAEYAVKILFDGNLIRKFIDDSRYDNIIRTAIQNHNKLRIQEGLDKKALLHSKIIRDADKLDVYRVKKEADVKALLPLRVTKLEDLEYSLISDKVYETILQEKCVINSDRVTPLDFSVNIIAFTFDLNFKVTFQMLKEKNYINDLIDRFEYKNEKTNTRMKKIKNVVNDFIDKKIKEV